MALFENFELVLVEDVISHPVCKVNGWDKKALRKMIRDGGLDGKIDSQGSCYVSEASLLRRNFGLQIDLAVKRRALELASSGDPSINYEEIAFFHLFSKLLNIKVRSLDQLRIALENIQL